MSHIIVNKSIVDMIIDCLMPIDTTGMFVDLYFYKTAFYLKQQNIHSVPYTCACSHSLLKYWQQSLYKIKESV